MVSGSVDGFFSSGRGSGDQIDYGYKGIPRAARNLEFGPLQKPRDSTIVNGSIFLILSHLRSLNPGASEAVQIPSFWPRVV
jgi:hypothetical protein